MPELMWGSVPAKVMQDCSVLASERGIVLVAAEAHKASQGLRSHPEELSAYVTITGQSGGGAWVGRSGRAKACNRGSEDVIRSDIDREIRVLNRAGQLTGAKIGRERAAQRRSTRCIVAYALDGVVRRTTARHIAAARGACATIIDSVVARRGAAGLQPFTEIEVI